MHPFARVPAALALTAVVSLSAAPARASPGLTLVAQSTSNLFTGDRVQAVSLAEVNFSVGFNSVGVSAQDAQSIQLVSVANPALALSMPNATQTSFTMFPSGAYDVNGVYDPSQCALGVVSALPFTVSGTPGVGQPERVSGSANVLRELHAITPTGLLSTLGGNGKTLEIALPLNDFLATFVTAVVDWGDGTITTTLLPVTAGVLDIVPADHDYGTPGVSR